MRNSIYSFIAALFLFCSTFAFGDDAGHQETFVAGEALTIDVVLDSMAFIKGGHPIDSLGYVDLPVIGKLSVAGRTRDDVEAFLSTKLANYLRDTHISVKPAIRITWLGYWVKAGQYYVSPNSTVWEAVRMAGGIAGERNLEKLQVRRGEQFVTLHVLNAYADGTSLAQAGIRSGDIVIIPVPRDNEGFWYWFRETLTVTAQIASVATSAMSAYIIYLNLQNQK